MATNEPSTEASTTGDNAVSPLKTNYTIGVDGSSRLGPCLRDAVCLPQEDSLQLGDLLDNDPEILLEVEVEAGNSNELDPGPSVLGNFNRDCEQDNIDECDSNQPESSSTGPEDVAGGIHTDQVDSADGEDWNLRRMVRRELDKRHQDAVSSEADDEGDDEEDGGIDSSSDEFDHEESIEARLRVYGDRTSGNSPQETDLSPIASCSSQPSPPRVSFFF